MVGREWDAMGEVEIVDAGCFDARTLLTKIDQRTVLREGLMRA
jgi:hypothetical protein